MKTLDTKWMLKVAGVAILSSVMITGCGGGSKKPNPVDPPPVEEPDPVLPPEVGDDIAQVISGSVIKASDGSIIDGAVVNFLENGAAATNIADVDGNVITSITAAEGSFEVTIKEGATIDQFTIVASATGFIEKSTVVDVIADADVISTQLELTANAGVGVATTEKEATVENAVAAADIIVDTDDGVAQEDDTTVGSATVAVAASTQLQDAAGNPVTGTAVKVAVTFVEETDDQQANAAEATTVAAAIPAGLNEVEEVAEVSIPLAVAQVNVTATDTATNTTTEVKKFSAPITITFNLPATTKVRSADRLVQEGDQFTVKSFDEDEGIWKVEPNKAIVGAENVNTGAYPAALLVDHLTFFAVTDGVAACNQDINLNYSGDAIPASGLFVRVFSNDIDITGLLRSGVTQETLTAAEAKALGIAANATAAVRVRDTEGNIWFSTIGDADGVAGDEVDFCGDVNIALTNPVELVDENLSITAVCSNDTTVTAALTGALVKYRLDATKPYRVAPGNGDGTYTLGALVSGSEYSVLVDTNLDAVSELQTTTITADGTAEELDVSLTCAGGTGTGGTGGSGG